MSNAAPFEGLEPGRTLDVPRHSRLGTPDVVYTYVSAHGAPLFASCRFQTPEGKTFSQGHPTANGAGWAWNLQGVDLVPYRFDEVTAHLEANSPAPLYIVEGEKAVDRVRSYLTEKGLPGTVTCSPMGAGKWRDEYSDALIGARWVIVVVDNDEPGRKHGRAIKASLRPHVDRFELKRPAIEEEHAGLDDHLDAGKSLDELLDLDGEPGEEPPLLPVVSLADFIADKDEEAAVPLVGAEGRPLIPRFGLVVVGGQGGAAKTTYTFDTVAHLAAGSPWEGEDLERPLRILLIDVEGPREPYREKLEHKVAAWTGPDFVHNVFVLAGDKWGRFSFADPDDRRRLVATCRELEIDLVVANPLGRLGMEGGGTPDEVGRFVEYLRECGLWTERAFWLIHHFNRGLSRDVLMRLSGAWDRDADLIIGLAREGTERKTKRTWAKVRHVPGGGPENVSDVLEWDVETLGFRKVETAPAATLEEVRERVLAHLEKTPGAHSTTAIRKAVKGTDALIDEVLRELFEGLKVGLSVGGRRIEPGTVGDEDFADWRRQKAHKHWEASIHAGSPVGGLFTPTDADIGGATPAERLSRRVGGDPVGGADYETPTETRVEDDEEVERLAELAREAQANAGGAGREEEAL